MHSVFLYLLAVGLCLSAFSAGCQQDLDVRDRTFSCQNDRDCLDGFVCEQGEQVCVRLTTDAGDVDDAGQADASDADTVSDADEILDADEGACPVARLKVREFQSQWGESDDEVSLSTTVLRTVELDASASRADQGLISDYEWSLIDKPSGSTTTIVVDEANTDEAKLFMDLYGEYEVRLRVTDSSGTPGCEAATAVIDAAPTDDVAIELSWYTFDDSGQHDGEHADLDLHYVRAGHEWNASGDDGAAYPANYSPDWGASDYPNDDPIVVDNHERPAELLFHNELEWGQTYGVGVHYVDANGLGEINATMRVYIDGVMAYSINTFFNDPGEFWKVGRIDGSTETFDSDSEMSSGFPEPIW